MTPSLPSAGLALRALRVLVGSGVVAPVRPDRLLRIAAAPLRGGVGIGAVSVMGAARHPGRPALVDELGRARSCTTTSSAPRSTQRDSPAIAWSRGTRATASA